MNPKPIAEWITLAVFAFGAFKWIDLQNKTRKDVQAIMNNHLPHLNHLLRLICQKLDIPITEPEGLDGRDKAGDS